MNALLKSVGVDVEEMHLRIINDLLRELPSASIWDAVTDPDVQEQEFKKRLSETFKAIVLNTLSSIAEERVTETLPLPALEVLARHGAVALMRTHLDHDRIFMSTTSITEQKLNEAMDKG